MSVTGDRKPFRRLWLRAIVACFIATALLAGSVTAAKRKAKKNKRAVAAKPQPKKAEKAEIAAKTAKADTATALSGTGAPELTPKASQAIDKGLKFLLSVQNPDGSWDEGGNGRYAVGITSLALMAFMAKAYFPGSGPYGKQLDRAKNFLLKKAKEAPDGYLGSVMYEHGLATLALSEMWGMTGDKEHDDDAIQKALEAAVKVILRSQNVGGGWRYQPQMDAGQDTSVTVMVFVALASARQAGILVPNETIKKVISYLHGAQNAENGGFTYPADGHGSPSLACTAGGAYIAELAGQRDSEMVSAAIRYLEKQEPGIFSNGRYFYYTHYYALQAMVQAGDKQYAAWYPHIRDALISRQQPNGSWNRKNEVGAGHETPMAIITLAAPYRYIPIYQR